MGDATPAAAGKTVVVTATGTAVFQANVRKSGDPMPAARKQARKWTYALDPGDYFFNVDTTGIVGTAFSFAFTGAAADPPTAFTLQGVPGTDVSDNEDIGFTVAGGGAGQ
jgi:hypothetical protein